MTKNLKRNITRTSLVQELMQRYEHLNLATAEKVIDVFFQEIITALVQDKTVTLRRFGTFKPKIRPAYIARNPRTGQKINLTPKKLASFKVSPIFSKNLNQGEIK